MLKTLCQKNWTLGGEDQVTHMGEGKKKFIFRGTYNAS